MISRILLNNFRWMQNYLVQATYWHDPLNEAKYVEHSTFLADINNEKSINQTYIDNLMKLNRFVCSSLLLPIAFNLIEFNCRFVMVKFTEDTIVQPLQSQWFEFYAPNQDRIILPLNESVIFTQVISIFSWCFVSVIVNKTLSSRTSWA